MGCDTPGVGGFGSQRDPDAPTTPILYAALYHHSTDQLRQEVETRLASEASRAARHAAGWVSERIRDAYFRGVTDGFAQGVAAVAHREEEAFRRGVAAAEGDIDRG